MKCDTTLSNMARQTNLLQVKAYIQAETHPCVLVRPRPSAIEQIGELTKRAVTITIY